MLSLTTTAFKPNETIPLKHAGPGADISPALSFTGIPPRAQSLCLIMDDPDAPPGTWVHWILYDWPASRAAIEEGLAKTETLPNGAKQGICWGVDSFERVGYYGPYPPPGKPHRYFFKLFALDSMLNLKPKADINAVKAAMKGKILAQAELVGLFGR
jgi:hypothetical protein